MNYPNQPNYQPMPQQPAQPQQYQAQAQTQTPAAVGGQYEKNPNGGYLNPSNYGNDGWWGNITITPELMIQIQQTGKVLIEVKDTQTSEYGPCRRIVAKPYKPKPVQEHAPVQVGNVPLQPAPTSYPPQPYAPPQPYTPPPINNQQPGTVAVPSVTDNIGDEIPF